MKIVITVCEVAGVAHAGGDPQRVSAVVELPTDGMPESIRRALDDVGTERGQFTQVSASIMLEPKLEGGRK